MATIAGRYEVVAQLDEGGMGVVFRAYDPPPMDRYVAVKTLSRTADPQSLALFYKECAALKSLSHPNIVEIFDMGEFEEGGFRKPFFVMPLLAGQTLQQLIQDTSRLLTVERVVEIFVQLSKGLQAAHEHGLIHRDLKPSNIFVLADDAVKIIDFGVARVASMESRATGAGGTLAYMAPEVLQHKPVSTLSDVYSLGVTLYEALTRKQPYLEATEDTTANAILTRIPSIASDLNPSVSHLVSRVAHKAMAKQPKSRFESAREFGVALQKAARNEPIAVFDPARTRPRIQTAARALDRGEHEFANEIVTELEAEGEIDPELKVLRTQIDHMSRRRRIAQLLESARACHEHDEDKLALSKLDEILQLDPANAAALGLKSRVEDHLSARQLEPWIQAARQRRAERSYDRAREALRNALALRPNDKRVARLLAEIEREEQKHFRLRQQKEEAYQSAVRAWTNGDVRQALSHMRTVLDLDGVAPEPSPETTAGYQAFYERIRAEHEASLARNPDPDPAPAPSGGLSQDVTSAVPEHPRWASRRIGVMVAAAVAIALIVRALLTGGAPPKELAPVGPVRVEPRAETAGVLTIGLLPPGLRVSLDGSPIGLVGDDGRFSYAGIRPGTHVLQFTGAGYVSTAISRKFAAGAATTVTAVDVALARAPAPIQFIADADTEVTLVRQGTALQTFRGSATLQMAEGDYTVSVKGPAGVPTFRRLTVSAGLGQIVDANALLVRGMERFPAGWRTSDTWFAHRGGGLILYDRRTTNGAFRFTVRLDRSGNPYSTGDRLTWVVGYVDERNHVRMQLDRRALYRTDIIDGRQQSETIPHNIPTNLPFVHLSIEISAARLVHQYSTDGLTWRVLNTWTRTRPAGQRDAGRPMPLDGKFGFVLRDNEEVFLSNFVFDPRSR